MEELFDPAIYKGEMIIAVNEFPDMVFMPVLVEELSRVVPGLHLVTLTQVDNQLDGLGKGELVFKTLPFNLDPDIRIEYCLVSHDRVTNSPANQWLRERIIALAGQWKL